MREGNTLLAEQVAVLQVQIECFQALIGAMSKELEVVDIGVRVKLAVAAAAAVRDIIDDDDHSNARGRHLRFIANMLNVPLHHVIGTTVTNIHCFGEQGASPEDIPILSIDGSATLEVLPVRNQS